MSSDPLDAALTALTEQLATYVALAKSAPDEGDLLEAVELVRDANDALVETIANRTGHRISWGYAPDFEDDEDGPGDAQEGLGVRIAVEELLRIVDVDKLVRAAGSPGPEDQPGDTPAERAVCALLQGVKLEDFVADADRYGLGPMEGATSVELFDLSG